MELLSDDALEEVVEELEEEPFPPEHAASDKHIVITSTNANTFFIFLFLL